MRALAGLLLLSTLAGAETADEYFETGLDYLRKGLYRPARAALSESLLRAPGEPVPMAFLALACAAEGRPPAEAATLLRWSSERLPDGKVLRLDLPRVLPSAKALALLQADYRRRLAKAEGAARRPVLVVLAFLEAQDGDPVDAPALDRLLREAPADPVALALAALRPPPDAAPDAP